MLWHNYILTGYPEDEVLTALTNKEQEFNKTGRRFPTTDSDGSTLIVNNPCGRLLEFNAMFEKHNISATDRNIFYQSISNGNNCVIRKSFYDVKLDKTSSDSTFTEEDVIESDSPPADLQADKSCVSSGSDADLIRQVLLEFGDTSDDTLGSSLQKILNEENSILSDVISSDDYNDDEIFPKAKKCSVLKNKLPVIQENCNILNKMNDSRTLVLKEFENTDISPEKAQNNSLKENESINNCSKRDQILNDSPKNHSHVIQTDWIKEVNIFPKKSQRKNSISKRLSVSNNSPESYKNSLEEIDTTANVITLPKNCRNLNSRLKILPFQTEEKVIKNNSPRKTRTKPTDNTKKVLFQADEKIEKSVSPAKAQRDRTVIENRSPLGNQNLNNHIEEFLLQSDDQLDNELFTKTVSSRKIFSVDADDQLDENTSPTKSNRLRKLLLQVETNAATPTKISVQTDENILSKRTRPKKLSLQVDEKLEIVTNNPSAKAASSRKTTSKKLSVQIDDKLNEILSKESSSSNNRRKNNLTQSGERARTDNVFKTPQKVSGKIQKVGHPPLSSDSSNISISSRGRIRRQTSDFWIGKSSLICNLYLKC